MDPALQQRREFCFLILAGLFLGTLGMLNILGLTRFLELGHIGSWPVVVAVGALPYPITFLCTDLISELWGEKRAAQVVWVGLLLNGWVVLILWLGGVLPGVDGAPDATFFEIQRLAFGSVIASMAAYLTAQFVDVRMFHFWKRVSNGKPLAAQQRLHLASQWTRVPVLTAIAPGVLPVRAGERLPRRSPSSPAAICSSRSLRCGHTPFIWITQWLRHWLHSGSGNEIGGDDDPLMQTIQRTVPSL